MLWYCGDLLALTSGRFCAPLQTFRELEIFCTKWLSTVEAEKTHRNAVQIAKDRGSDSSTSGVLSKLLLLCDMEPHAE